MAALRFSRANPCPICAGHPGLPKGHGVRCWGRTVEFADGGRVAFCTREEHASPGSTSRSGFGFPHPLDGRCSCGQVHENVFVPVPIAKPANPANPADSTSALAARIWADSRPASGSPAETYLAARGITIAPPPTLRFAYLTHQPSGRRCPTMVAAVTVWPAARPSAIHRTYLAEDGRGKAPVAPQKKALGPVRGGAVCLAPAGPLIVVAEGLETALSVQQATGLPAWCVLSAGNMANLVLPLLPLAAEVVIAADPDPAGRHAAYQAAEAWHREGRRIRIATPPAGSDFNDVLQRAEA